MQSAPILKDFSKNRTGRSEVPIVAGAPPIELECERGRNKLKITQVSSAGSGGCIEERQIALFDAS
jgi:hypothetical protein